MPVHRHRRVGRPQPSKSSRDTPAPELRRGAPRNSVRRRRRRLDLPPLLQLAPLERQVGAVGAFAPPVHPTVSGHQVKTVQLVLALQSEQHASAVGVRDHRQVAVEDLALEQRVRLDDTPFLRPLLVGAQAVAHADAAVARGARRGVREIVEHGLQGRLGPVAGEAVGFSRLGVGRRLAADKRFDLELQRAERVEVGLGVLVASLAVVALCRR